MTNDFKVAVIGDWHLAFVSSSVLAHVGHKTALVKPLNLNPTTWGTNYPPCPVHEPGLPEMIADAQKQQKLFHFNGITTDWNAEFIWMAVDTPVNDKDEPDTAPLVEIMKTVKALGKQPKAFIVSSQIPVGFSQMCEAEFGFKIAYIPENLRLGKGIETFYKADRTIIGASDTITGNAVRDLLSAFPTEFVLCNLQTSEMIKHANNIFLATSISFANELARVGEKFGVDSHIVAKALKLDKRIGTAAYVAPGLGFAGGTLPRDLRVVQKKGQELGVPTSLVNAVLRVNEESTQALAESVVLETPKNGKVLILGYTYKADTDTLRRSMSLDLADILLKSGLTLWGFDPFMNGKDLTGLGGRLKHFDNIEDLPERPDTIVIMTARPQFKEVAWNRLGTTWKVSHNSLVFDTQNILDSKKVKEGHFKFKKLWSPAEA